MSLQGGRRRKGICKDSIKLLTYDVSYNLRVETGTMVELSQFCGNADPEQEIPRHVSQCPGKNCLLLRVQCVRTVSRCLQQKIKHFLLSHTFSHLTLPSMLQGRLISILYGLEINQQMHACPLLHLHWCPSLLFILFCSPLLPSNFYQQEISPLVLSLPVSSSSLPPLHLLSFLSLFLCGSCALF